MVSSIKEVCIEAINLRTLRLNGFKLLIVYSREYGLLKLSGSKLGGRSEPFVRNRYWIGLGSEEIHRIKQSEFQDYYRQISADYERLTCASAMAEILEQCTHFHEEQSAEVFGLFEHSLSDLNLLEKPTESVILDFLWKISDLIGYGMRLRLCGQNADRCSLASSPHGIEAWLDFEHGGINCSGCQLQKTSNSITILPEIYRALIALKNDAYGYSPKASVLFLVSMLLRYLQNQTECKFKSADLLKETLNNSKIDFNRQGKI